MFWRKKLDRISSGEKFSYHTLMAESCKRKSGEEAKLANQLSRALVQFFKTLLILSCIFVLVLVRKGMKDRLNIGIIIAYILLACLALVIIYLSDQFVYNNLLIGLGAYLGFELLKIN